jgi:hypothetical protein
MEKSEFQLLLLCAHLNVDAAAISALASEDLDWHMVLELARQHGVRPFLRLGLKTACWGAIPQFVQIELEQFNRINLTQNLLFTGELLRLVGAFKENGIKLAAFKGPILAESVYGDLSLREFCDLDILVHQADVLKAEDLLASYGYQADFPDRDFRETFLSYQYQYAFRNHQTGISVDLHWELFSKGMAFPIQSEDVWSKLTQITIAGREIPTLANDDLVLFLAAHGTKERWRSLLWVRDFATLLHKHQDIDWLAILDRSKRSHSLQPLLLAIFLASELLGTDAPPQLIDEARSNSRVRGLAKDAELRMIRPEAETEVGQFLSGLATRDRLRHRLLPIITLLTTRTVGDYEAIPLPKMLWGGYFLIRPFRLAAKALEMNVRLFYNDR